MVAALLALRMAVLKKHKAASAKVSRMRANGVEVSGTAYDPRRSADAIKKYNGKQLNAYLDQLNTFTNRNFKLRATKDGQIIDPKRWASYELTQRQYNKMTQRDFDKHSNLQPPNSGYTIGERVNIRASVKAGANTENLVFNKVNRDPRNVKDAASLDKLQDQLERKMSGEWRETQLTANRSSCYSMIDDIGAASLRTAVEKLNDEQFYVLWSKTSFRDILKEIYYMQKESKGNGSYDGSDLDDAFDLVNWASTIGD